MKHFLVFVAVLATILVLFFASCFKPNIIFFSNDGSLGAYSQAAKTAKSNKCVLCEFRWPIIGFFAAVMVITYLSAPTKDQ